MATGLAGVVYPWQRYWCPIEATYYIDQHGYVEDPQTAFNPNLVKFSDITPAHTIVLLGEPGIGKTRAMADERSSLEATVKSRGEELLWVDLKEYGNEDRLVRTIFEGPEVQRWLAGEHDLHLFFDSLDEGLLRIETLSSILLSFLRRWPLERLNLRIACRTADWPRLLDDGLRALPELQPIQIMELAGLTRRDIQLAAKVRTLDEAKFTTAIERAGAVPLAIKPVTLELLLRTFAVDRGLPPTQAALYLIGCRLLCSEPPPAAAELDTAERLAIASRIAATTIYGGKAAVWTGPNLGDVADSDIPIEELAGGTETSAVGVKPVTERAVREVLRTSLFSARTTTDRLGFAHHTFAEYLAAYYVRDLPLPQVMSLLIHPGDPEGRVVPQLREPAAWVATLRADVFRAIAERDPSVLLRSDAAAASDDDRKELVAQLLKSWSEGKLLQRGWEVVARWSVLAHPGLAAQLRPYIRSRSKNDVARQEAIDMAEANELTGLGGALLRVALDPRDKLHVRVNAAYAISRIGDEATKARLSPLLNDARDENDELLGVALRALWPIHLSTGELFKVLRPARNRNFLGAYQMFLNRELAAELPAADLPLALDWIADMCVAGQHIAEFERLMDGIIIASLDHLDELGVADRVAKALLARHRQHYQFFDHVDEKVLGPIWTQERRRQIVTAMVAQFTDPDRDRHDLLGGLPRLIDTEDVTWLIDQGLGATGSAPRAWALLAQFCVNWQDPRHTEALYEACQQADAFKVLFGTDFEAVELGSDRAAEMKKSYDLWNRTLRREPKPKGPSPQMRVAAQLVASEAGEVEAWWRLNREMTLKPEHVRYPMDHFGEPDVRKFPGWEVADEGVRARIVRAAKQCILEFQPKATWIGTSTVSEADMAGYRAFRLIGDLEPSFLQGLSPDIWKKWAPVLLAAPVDDDPGAQATFVSMAYPHAQAEVIRTLLKLIDKENASNGTVFATRDLGDLWDNALSQALHTKLQDAALKPGSIRALLEKLLEHRDDSAIEFALARATRPGRRGTPERAVAVVCAELLLRLVPERSWSAVWAVMRRIPAFGVELALAMSELHDLRGGALRLTEAQAADFFIWLYQRFPPREDPPQEGFLPPRALLSDMRDSLVTFLRERGTPAAVGALRRIQRELKLGWFSRHVLQAERLVLARSWTPPSPGEILKLAADADRRLVESGDQLVQLLSESLSRFENELQGEQPAVIGLWDEIGHGSYRPKPEVVLADAIARHFRRDLRGRGLAALREVEIRRGHGGQGERTDVYVTAVRLNKRDDGVDTIPVVVEVKASWSRDLETAMTQQLAERYMKRSRLQHGLYAVGWYSCRRWARGDTRLRRLGRRARVQTTLQAEAQSLSASGFAISTKIVDCELR